jgi:hypothetical protein
MRPPRKPQDARPCSPRCRMAQLTATGPSAPPGPQPELPSRKAGRGKKAEGEVRPYGVAHSLVLHCH